jgi:hypothetical protein
MTRGERLGVLLVLFALVGAISTKWVRRWLQDRPSTPTASVVPPATTDRRAPPSTLTASLLPLITVLPQPTGAWRRVTPFDAVDLTDDEWSAIREARARHQRRAIEIGRREALGEITPEEADQELTQLDVELADLYITLLGDDRVRILTEELQEWYRDEWSHVYDEATDPSERTERASHSALPR